uniref:Uncharacterized protein n=1 Tax=Aegilops tauschii subsp. strangulata TaxID=200361 RepID=A0A453N168_AEGTS
MWHEWNQSGTMTMKLRRVMIYSMSSGKSEVNVLVLFMV